MARRLVSAIAALILSFYPINVRPVENQRQREIPALEAHFIDVGQGDAALLDTPAGKHILIDCGSTETKEKVIQYLKDRGIRTIDVLITSHPDADHIGGCAAVINAFGVSYLYDNGLSDSNNSAAYKRYEAARKKVSHYAEIPLDMAVKLEEMVTLNFIVPYDNGGIIEEHKDNNNSLLVKIVIRSGSFEGSYLFTGDCEKECEERVLDDGLRSSVLKVAHHGSSTSSSKDFLDKVTPECSIVSYGRGNRYGHPDADTMARIKGASKQVFETTNGSVACTASSEGISCRHE